MLNLLVHSTDNTIPKEILHAPNTLLEEVKTLESRTSSILKVPNLIFEVVIQNTFLIYSSPFHKYMLLFYSHSSFIQSIFSNASTQAQTRAIAIFTKLNFHSNEKKKVILIIYECKLYTPQILIISRLPFKIARLNFDSDISFIYFKDLLYNIN
jgi:hypothetical protein